MKNLPLDGKNTQTKRTPRPGRSGPADLLQVAGPSTVYIPEKAALPLHPLTVIDPAPMLAVTLPPLSKCSVNSAVVPPLMTWTLVTLPPTLPVRVRSLVCTDAASTAWLKFTSY